jgi:hypothetical protein
MALVDKKYEVFLFPPFSKDRKDKGFVSTGIENK